ncbi:MAG TPA: hypothetical protein VJ924_00025 [Alphaproteobacteria bacterium]|nr:hypothetical protein [Alphaproteobacteria bacterium]
MRIRVLTFAAILALAGCAGVSTVTNFYYNSAYTPAHVTLAAANNPSQAVIRGSPFANDIDNQGVIAAMQGQNWGPKMFFAPTPRPDDLYGYKMVIAFNGMGPNNDALCKAPPAPAKPSGGDRIDASIAFCVGEVLLTDASGHITGVSGPEDPKFKRLISDLMLTITPPYDPNRRGDDCIGFGC